MIKLTQRGDILPDEEIDNKELQAQRVRQILSLRKGSAFWDLNRGLNYEAVNAGLLTREQIVAQASVEILKIQGVEIIASSAVVLDNSLNLSFSLRIRD